ncbi:DMT family transporter [Salinarimonas ramus]|uniref:Membrane protein n=1 Tax=Salinarimonas ramus TaxID=690164 RepID=A0A917Q8D5_9HYPH|nr:DMT family transporter [Salinarimonas ramus]GGK34869.1 membrane protein [Salinarimonas ramus]
MADARKRNQPQAPAAKTPRLPAGATSQAYLFLTITALSWGGNAVAGRLAVGEVSPMALTALRWLCVVTILVPLAWRDLRAHEATIRAHWRRIALMAVAGFTSFNALLYAAAHYTSAVNLTIIQGGIPVVVLVGALVVYGTRITTLQVAGMLVTLAGVATVAAQGSLATLLSLSFNPGDVLMMAAGLAYAGYTLALRSRPAMPQLAFFTAMAAVAFLASLPLLAFEVTTGSVIWPGPTGLAILAFVAVFPSLIAQLFFMRGVELIGPGRAGLFVNLVPVFGAMLAVAILSEPFHLYHAVALALVLGGIALAERGKGKVESTAGARR